MTRMGPHCNTPHRAGIAAEYIRRVKPDAVKVLSSGMDGQVIAAAKEVGALIIGRLYWDDQKLGAAYGDFTRRVVQWARENPDIGWLEGANEFAQSPGELERYADLEIERMKALDAIGRKAVIGNFSCGQPDLAQWSRFRPALEYAAAHGHCLGLHSYSGPVMQWLAGGNQWNGGAYTLTDPCEGPGVEGWLTLRYRKALKQFKAWGIGHIKIAITESGIDDVQPRPGPQGKGWKSYLGTEYANMAPFGDYADQLAWYARRLTEDANIIAWVDFGFSQAGDWSTFDLSDSPVMRERVITAMQAIPRGHPSTVPAPQPQPEQPMPTPTPSGIINMPAMSHSPRGGTRARYVVVHSTDSPAGSTPEGTAKYLAGNDRKVSAHELVAPLAVYVMVPDDRAAHHAGYATLPDGTTGGAVNLASWGLEIYQESGRPCDPALVEIAAGRVAGACKRLNIPAARVVSHAEIDPGRRSDPVGVDMVKFRARVSAMLAEGGQPAPAPGVVQWGKVVWFLEDMIRRMEAEGQRMEAALVKSTWLPEAIRHRDGKA